jgi:hypothetical protein
MGNGTVRVFRIQPLPDNVAEVTAPPPPKPMGPPTELWKQLVGKPAPEFQVKGWVTGQPVRLADLRGRHVLLHFSNLQRESWMASLIPLHEQFSDRGLAIIVVEPDQGATVEGLRNWLAEEGRRSWGGRELPFAVALDGGGETLVAGTQLKAPGATHAAYRIIYSHRGWRVNGTTLLIGPNGNVLRSVELPLRTADVEAFLGKKAKVPASRARFELLYALAPGTAHAHIAPPFPPERTDYLLAIQALPGVAAFTHRFRYDGKLSLDSSTSREELSLGELPEFVLGLKRIDFEVAADLAHVKVRGDWVYRLGTPKEQLVSALEDILRDDLKVGVRLRRREVERDVVVVRGRFKFQPLPGDDKVETVHFSVDVPPGGRPWPGTFRSVEELLVDLQDIVQHRFVNEAHGPATMHFRWENHLGSDVLEIHQRAPAGVAKLRKVLDNLSKQTGLEFRTERRKVSVTRFEKD